MTFQNVVDGAQQLLADRAAARYEESELLVYANEAQRHVCAMMPPEVIPNLWQRTYQDVIAQQDTYSQPADLWRLAAVGIITTTTPTQENDQLFIIPAEQALASYSNEFYALSSCFRIVFIRGESLIVSPTPTATVINGLVIDYLKRQGDGTLSDSLIVTEPVGDCLKFYVAAMARYSDGEETTGDSLMRVFDKKLEQIAGPFAWPPTARRLRRR